MSKPTRPRPRFYPLRVTAKESLTDTAVAVTFEVPAELAGVFEFRAGQHLTVRARIQGEEVRRSYSICISPRVASELGALKIGVGRVEGGAMSSWLVDRVGPGESVDVLPPLGDFTVPTVPSAVRRHVAIAAGTGITPVLSLVTSFLEDEPDSSVTLIYGNRRLASAMFRDEIARLESTYPNFATLLVTSQEAQPNPLATGRLDETRLREILDTHLGPTHVDHWYACGPDGVVAAVQAVLHDRGIPGERVHVEVFEENDGTR